MPLCNQLHTCKGLLQTCGWSRNSHKALFWHLDVCFQTATSLKVNIDCWNKMTIVWLRRVVYDRSPRAYSTWAVFAVSAIWHGFYPGYYLTFFSAALCTVAARLVSSAMVICHWILHGCLPLTFAQGFFVNLWPFQPLKHFLQLILCMQLLQKLGWTFLLLKMLVS